MIVGISSVSKARQTGHWRSMYSTIRTFAFGEPRTLPCCGIPRKSARTAAESGKVDVDFDVDEEDEEPRVIATAAAAAPPASRSTSAAIRSTFGEALRAPVLRTGGGAGVRRCCRAFLPLVTVPR